MFGELIPHGGGDPIPLMKTQLVVGRRESCDIVLRFGNISAHHCELLLEHGYWFVKDLNSRNGTKVNGLRVSGTKRIDPGDRLSIAKRNYNIQYSPADLGADGPPPDDMALSDILGQSLMSSAGLNRRERQEADGRVGVRRPTEQATNHESDDGAAENRAAENGAADEAAAPTPDDETETGEAPEVDDTGEESKEEKS
ncbi:MAG: FHA domain-containing protein [Pirellulaceae bacterium]